MPQRPQRVAHAASTLLLSLLVAGAATAAPDPVKPAKPSTQPSKVLIQFKPESEQLGAELLEAAPTQRSQRAKTQAQQRLNRLLTTHKAGKVRRVGRKAAAQALKPLAGPEAAKRVAQHKAHLAQRAKRTVTQAPPAAPRGARYVVELELGADAQAAAEALAQDPAVQRAQVVPEASFDQFTPNDPVFTQGASGGLWGMYDIGMPTAWEQADGTGITVAVIDVGVERTHPDIAGNMWVNPGEDLNGNGLMDASDTNGVDDDGNGFIDDLWGWNFVEENNDPTDLGVGPDREVQGHGTHVAGTIGALGNNNLAVIGGAFKAKLMAVRMNDPQQGADAIIYAVDNGADVINASWSSSGNYGPLTEALAYAAANGVVVVSAAGNGGNSADSYWPCAAPEAICVTATNSVDEYDPRSNQGNAVTLGAPGVDITSLYFGWTSGTETMLDSGTSMAAPHATAAAALLLQKWPTLTIAQVRQMLRNGAEDIEASGWDTNVGFGLLAVDQALAGQPPVIPKFTELAHTNAILRPLAINGIQVKGVVENQPSASAASWQLSLTDEGNLASTPSIVASGTGAKAQGTLKTLSADSLISGRSYRLDLTATATNGQISADVAKVKLVEPVWGVAPVTASSIRSFAISGDGQTIVVTSPDPLDPSLPASDTMDEKLFRYHPETQQFELLLRTGVDTAAPYLNADGTILVYHGLPVGAPQGAYGVFWVNLADREIHRIVTPAPEDTFSSGVLMDGSGETFILHTMDSTGRMHIVRYRRQSEAFEQVLEYNRIGTSLSQDGRWLGGHVIGGTLDSSFVYDFSSNVTFATPPTCDIYLPYLRRNGSRLICLATAPGGGVALQRYTHDLQGHFTLEDFVPLGDQGSSYLFLLDAADDGNRALLTSTLNLDPMRGNPNNLKEYFIYDFTTHTFTQVSYCLSYCGGGGLVSLKIDNSSLHSMLLKPSIEDADYVPGADLARLFLFRLNPRQMIMTGPAEPPEVVQGQSLSFDLTAEDPTGGSISWTAAYVSGDDLLSLGELGATLKDWGDGRATLRWLPWFGQVGPYEFAFQAISSSGQVLSLSVVVTVIPAVTYDVEVVAAEDAQLSSKAPEKNYSAAKKLKVRWSLANGVVQQNLALLKFDLRGISQQVVGGADWKLVNARLRFAAKPQQLAKYSNFGYAFMGIQRTQTGWTESTVTYATQPPPSSSFVQVPVTFSDLHEVDVTSLMVGDIGTIQTDFVSLGFYPRENQRMSVAIPSRETNKEEERPRLCLTITPNSAPPASFDFSHFAVNRPVIFSSASTNVLLRETGKPLPETGEITVQVTVPPGTFSEATLLLKAYDLETGEGTVALNSTAPIALPAGSVGQERVVAIPIGLASLQQGGNALHLTHTSGNGFEIRGAALRLTIPPGDFGPPTAKLTAPTGTVSGATTLKAEATDDLGVAQVQFLIDGALLSADTSAPYEAPWDTRNLANGAHTLQAKATDARGNVGNSALVTVTVTNPVGAPTALGVVNTSYASAVGGMAVMLDWVDGSTNETVFVVERSTSPTSGFAEVATTQANVPFYIGYSQPAGVAAYYQVKAKSGSTLSAPSNVMGVLTALVTADTFVNGGYGYAGQTFGTVQNLMVKASSPEKWGYLKFQLPTLPGKVTKATLKLRCSPESKCDQPVTLYQLSTSAWEETTLTHKLATATAGLKPTTGINRGVLPAVSGGSWVSHALTGVPTAGGPVSYGLATSSTTEMSYRSREGGEPAHILLIINPQVAP